MTSLGNALLGALLGHTDAEKLFRPWWDSLEDFVVYGLIMLGLIVSPTTIFNGTPLQCTICSQEGQCGEHPGLPPGVAEPGYHWNWVRSYCTMTSLSLFTLYFPYILLLSALLLAGIERLFGRLFKTSKQIDGFYSLLQHEKTKTHGEIDGGQEDLEDTIKTVEIRQSFKDSSSFFGAYLVRTILEFLVALTLAFYMVWFGLQEITADKEIHCRVHSVYYECAGVPHQFYLSVLLVALGLLAMYLVTTFTTIMWLICPCTGRLAGLMKNYSYELKVEAVAEGKENTSAKVLMGDLYDMYYENRDLRLLLDLLAATSGLASPLRVMALLDNGFRKDCAPIIHSLERGAVVAGESDVVLEFSESHLARNILGKMSQIQCLYTLQISPRTDKDSVEVIVFNKEDEGKFFSYSLSYFRKNNSCLIETPRKKFTFSGVDADTTYTVKVSLVLNGRAIATTQKKLKAITPDIVMDDQDIAKAAIMASKLNLQMPEGSKMTEL